MSANLNSPELDGMYPFLSGVADRRRRARQHIEAGAVTAGFEAVRLTVLRLLNEALTTELICVVGYRRHCAMSGGAEAETVRGEFLKYAQEEQGHADRIAERIVQLGGEPNLNPLALHPGRGRGDTGAATRLHLLQRGPLLAP